MSLFRLNRKRDKLFFSSSTFKLVRLSVFEKKIELGKHGVRIENGLNTNSIRKTPRT